MERSETLPLEIDISQVESATSRSQYQPNSSPYSGYDPVIKSSQRSIKSQRKNSWWQDIRRNQPQQFALFAPFFIFASGGVCYAWSASFGPTSEYGAHSQICWFIAVIIGACLSAVSVHKISKCIFYLIASVIVIASGVLFIALSNNTSATIFARYCNGVAFGLTLIPSILAGCEQTIPRFRGSALCIEQLGLAAGLLLVTLNKLTNEQSEFKTSEGHSSIIFGIMAFVCNLCFTIESPLFYIRKDDEDEALNTLRQLQRPKTITNETNTLFDECKQILIEDYREKSQHISRSIVPMIKTILFRILVSMSFSFPLTLGFMMASNSILSGSALTRIFFYTAMRFVGLLISRFSIDNIGRKIPSAISILIGGVLLVALGSLFSDIGYKTYSGIIIGLLIAYQLFAGITAPVSTCYLGEAFPVSVKPYFILLAVIFENAIQITICCLTTYSIISKYAYVLGGTQIVFAFVFFIVMPETKQTTLREALAKFRKTIILRPT